MSKQLVSRRIITYEVIGFFFAIIIIWADEVLDVPHFLLGAESTPINIPECVFESIIIFSLGMAVIYFTYQVFRKLRYLSGLLPICASCKKIRDDRGYWSQIELYIRNHSEVEFSHSICPECAKKLYPEFCEDNN